MNFINQALNLADTLREKVQEAANGIEDVVNGIKNTRVEITTSSINAVTDLQVTAQQGFQTVQNFSKALEGTAIGVTENNGIQAPSF